MDRHKSELHKSVWRMGKVLRDDGPKIFQIETTLNTDMFPSPFGFINKREWEWTPKDRAIYLGTHEVAATARRSGWPARSSTTWRARTR